ncbi:MAG: acetoacetate decarboxylase family protein [Polyangiaceae bacterium]|nr:acetoacetate decarboxylase family protein [Polyangiaceae bacterium]
MFTFDGARRYTMPAHFGALEGEPEASVYADVTAVVLRYETDGAALARYVPEGFELTEPVLEVAYQASYGVEWMAGGHYNLLGVTAPVAWIAGAERLHGQFALVVWENDATAIFAGREQLGIPKVFADVEDLHQLGDRRFATLSHGGAPFLELDIRLTRRFGPEELATHNREQGRLTWFGFRYVPNVGRPGAALSHATVVPVENEFHEAWSCEGSVRWQVPAWERNPTQLPILRALAGLPVGGVRGCVMTRGRGVLRSDAARPLP